MPVMQDRGIEIDLSYDAEGFPLVKISMGGSYSGELYRPAVEVVLEGVTIHDMFDNEEDGKDYRWAISDEEVKAARDALGNDEYPVEEILAAEGKHRNIATDALRRDLQDKLDLFESSAGRGVVLADEIDALRVVVAIRNHNKD